MRIRNKELRVRRHRKEQLQKEAKRVAIAAKGTTPKPEKRVAEKAPAKAKATAAKKPAAKADSADKPKRTPAKKKVVDPVASTPEEIVADATTPETPADPPMTGVPSDPPVATETA